MIIHLIVGLIKKTLYKMSQYFPKPYEPFGGDINATVDLSNYATKDDIKNITHVDTSSFALKTNLANLKTEVGKLDIDKLATVPVDLNKLSNVVKNVVVKKTVYDKLVAKVDNIDTSGFVKKTDYNTQISEIEDKIPDTSGLVKKTDYNTKITEIEVKNPDISGLATKTALITVENKIPSISGLVKKTDYNTKITDIKNKLNNHHHDKYVATSEFNALAANVFNARLAQENLITKTDFDAKLSSLNRKINANKTKHFLNDNDLSYYRGKQYFDEGSGKQNYLVFLPMGNYFKLNSVVGVIDRVLLWQSKGLSNESINPPTTSNNSLNARLSYNYSKIKVQFTGSYLKQPRFTFIHIKVVNIYIVYELDASSSHDSDPAMKNCLFNAVTLTKNADIEKYKYSGYGTGFDRKSSFSFTGGGFGQNILIFGADVSSSIHIDNNKKDILLLGRGRTQGLESTLTAEKMYSINFSKLYYKCIKLCFNE